MTQPAIRQDLLAIYQAALDSVNGRCAVKRYLQLYPVEDEAPCYLIATGKAATSMAQGALEMLSNRIVRALVITRYGYAEQLSDNNRSLELIEAGHPQPDENSLVAGQRLLKLLGDAPQNAHFIFLTSGGSSALVEVLPPSIDLDELQRINRWLLGSGFSISEINQVRKKVSLIKGGRLCAYLRGRVTLNLLMSDVPGDDVAVIGSGLLVEQKNSINDAVKSQLPGWLLAHVDSSAEAYVDGTPITTEIIVSSRDARTAASEKGRALGYEVHSHDRLLGGDAVDTGRWLANELQGATPGIHIWSSETTVLLPKTPGQGGRCQQLALSFAQVMGRESEIVLLVAGTDGSDGGINQKEADAGAIVDSGTLSRGELDGLDVDVALQQANAGAFLEASGDLISTGPTGANVMDLIIVYVPK